MAGLDDAHTCRDCDWCLSSSDGYGECRGGLPQVEPVTRHVAGWRPDACWPVVALEDAGCARHSLRYRPPASAEDLNLLTAADLNFVAEAVAGHLADIANVTVTDPDPVDLGKREG